jgi:hypothetical protein
MNSQGTISDEEERVDVCDVCGEPVDTINERAYAFGDEGIVCWSCAIDRGGIWDVERECWSTEPDLEGVHDAREPHP